MDNKEIYQNKYVDNKRIGKRIRKIRIERHLTQAELGEKVGLTADRIQRYENGVRKPKIDMLIKLAEALEVSPLALMDPDADTYIGAMYSIFELTHNFNILTIPDKETKTILLKVTDPKLQELLYEWMGNQDHNTDWERNFENFCPQAFQYDEERKNKEYEIEEILCKKEKKLEQLKIEIAALKKQIEETRT